MNWTWKMTEQKAIKSYNETSKIIENKFKEIDLIKFLFEISYF